MKKILLVVSTCFISVAALAQTHTKTISGTVHEGKNTPAEFASVLLFHMPDSLLEKSAVVDSAGNFDMVITATDTFALVVDYPGYARFRSENIIIDSNFTGKTFTIQLTPLTQTLD